MAKELTLKEISRLHRIGAAAVADLPDRGLSLSAEELGERIAAYEARELVPAPERGPVSRLAAIATPYGRRGRETPAELQRAIAYWKGVKGE